MVKHISLWQRLYVTNCLNSMRSGCVKTNMDSNKSCVPKKVHTEWPDLTWAQPRQDPEHNKTKIETKQNRKKRVPVNSIKRNVLLSVAQYAHYAVNNRLVTFKVKESIDSYRQTLYTVPHPHTQSQSEIAEWKQMRTRIVMNFHDHDIVSGEHKSHEDRKLESAQEIPFRSVE